jgi:hypothetical protein
MKHKSASIQPNLFEQNGPRVLPVSSQKEHLTTLIEALLLEIAATLATGEVGDDQITADHLGRGAFVYIRQSTADQILHNPESRRRQYGLADRARQLGWTTVEVIDDDLGRSGGGIKRPGFERLLTAICEGRVGAVFAIEASRLARNGRDWHTLIGVLWACRNCHRRRGWDL